MTLVLAKKLSQGCSVKKQVVFKNPDKHLVKSLFKDELVIFSIL